MLMFKNILFPITDLNVQKKQIKNEFSATSRFPTGMFVSGGGGGSKMSGGSGGTPPGKKIGFKWPILTEI